MARTDITSTEKLLNVIRSREEEPTPPAGVPDPPGRKKEPVRFPIPLPKLVSLRKAATVGIDIGHDYLRMVRATANSDGSWQLLDRTRIALPRKMSRDTAEFSTFLRTSLTSFCGSPKQANLWAIMSTARVDVRHIRIPKVPRKQFGNVAYWTAKKETPFDEKELIFDFESQGEVIDQGIPKQAVMVYTAPRQEIEALKTQFSRIGWPLTGISIVPFSVQNLFRTAWIPAIEGTIACLFIGNDYSRIDIYAEGNLVMTRGIKAGLSSMVESLVERFNDLKPDPTASHPLTPGEAREILMSLSPESPQLKTTDPGYDLAKETIFQMIEPALERLARQVERTLEHYTTTMPGERIAQLFVSGAMDIHQPIVDYIGNQLGVKSDTLDPLSGHESDVCGLQDEIDLSCVSERIAFGPALGLALSSNDHTPNLMFNYRDKERKARVIRINRALLALFIASLLVCSGFFAYQKIAIAHRRDVNANLEKQIALLGAPVNREQLTKMAAQVSRQRDLARVYADRYLGMVLISELTELTPANIRIIDMKINLGPSTAVQPASPAKDAPKDAAAPKARIEEITLEGVILGDREMLETSLAAYLMSLEGSPLFQQVKIQKSTVEPYLKGETLRFVIYLKVEEQVHG